LVVRILKFFAAFSFNILHNYFDSPNKIILPDLYLTPDLNFYILDTATKIIFSVKKKWRYIIAATTVFSDIFVIKRRLYYTNVYLHTVIHQIL